MGRAGRAIRVIGAFAGTLLIAACTNAPSASPISLSTAAATQTPIESPTEAPIVTAAPTVPPTPATVAGDWHAVHDQDVVAGTQFQDVLWTGERFVASGDALTGAGFFASSTDGQRWRSAPSGGTTGYPARLAAGANGIVAIGTLDGHTAAWHSTDGRKWTYRLKVFPKSLTGEDDVQVTDVVATDTGWLAVGRDDPSCQFACGETPLRALVWTSTDAASWTRVAPQSSLSKAAINAVTAIDGGYVAAGQGAGHAVIWTSVDGLTWKRVPDDPMFGPPAGSDSTASVSVLGVAAGNGSIVAVGMGFGVGDGGAPVVMAWRSIDGRTWTSATVEGAEEGQVFSVAATSTGFLATGPSGPTSCLGGIWASTDGARWACAASDGGFAGFGPYAAAGAPSLDVAVGLTSAGCEGDTDCPNGVPGAIWWRPVR